MILGQIAPSAGSWVGQSSGFGSAISAVLISMFLVGIAFRVRRRKNSCRPEHNSTSRESDAGKCAATRPMCSSNPEADYGACVN